MISFGDILDENYLITDIFGPLVPLFFCNSKPFCSFLVLERHHFKIKITFIAMDLFRVRDFNCFMIVFIQIYIYTH